MAFAIRITMLILSKDECMNKQFIYPVRVHIEDTDVTGVMYHGAHINFMERGRSEWLIEQGMGIEWQRQQGILFLIHSLSIQFLKPAPLHQMVEVVCSVKNCGRASIVFDQCIRLQANPEQIFSQAEIKIVCVDGNYKPCGIPAELKF